MLEISPNDDFVVKVALTKEEVAASGTLLDEMLQADFFATLSYDSFLLLEKLMKSIQDEVSLKARNKLVSERLNNMKDWVNDRCGTCKHIGHDHALGGLGLCIRESCPCMKFNGSKK